MAANTGRLITCPFIPGRIPDDTMAMVIAVDQPAGAALPELVQWLPSVALDEAVTLSSQCNAAIIEKSTATVFSGRSAPAGLLRTVIPAGLLNRRPAPAVLVLVTVACRAEWAESALGSTMAASTIAPRLLDVIDHDILPLTERGVAAGNKLFGAAILRKTDLSLVVAETNDETRNPLWHGEVHTLKRFYEFPDPPPTRDLVFLSTHEPCTMCMSAITWAGFDNFYYFFSHEDSRDSFAIPHDLKILHEVFGLEPGGYRRTNAFWTAYSIPALVKSEPEPERTQLREQEQHIRDRYDALSRQYQDFKGDNVIPLS